MVKSKILSIIFICSSIFSVAQISPNKYWVSFLDKEGNGYTIDQPLEFLTQRSIDRRLAQDIDIDWKDLPVTQSYVDQVEAVEDVEVLYTSRWFNAVAIYSEDENIVATLNSLPFVGGVKSNLGFRGDNFDWDINAEDRIHKELRQVPDYGLSFNQINMLNGIPLHDLGYEGQGMLIGICDAGFRSADEMLAFEDVFAEDRLVAKKDFVHGTDGLFEPWTSTHGTFVWSTIAGILPDSAYGSATQASFVLLRTEDIDSEYKVEEHNWIAGAEYADSLGVDILNTSLGYTTYNDSTQNYTYEDLDGNTSWITRGSDIAASRGILMINSAGNSGNSSWHYIGAAADGDSVLAIGAVDADEIHANFSSFGPSSDGRVKPNVMAQGRQAILCDFDNTPRTGNGTSFSGPILAGMAACLWQMHPEANNMDVFHAIEQSAHLYETPNDSMGFGIPDFWEAHLILESLVNVEELESTQSFSIFPNPSTGVFTIDVKNSSFPANAELTIEVFDSKGAAVFKETARNIENDLNLNLERLNAGLYTIQISKDSALEKQQLLIVD